MAAEQSAELKAVLELLPKGWKLKRLGPGRMNWVADLTFKNMQFALVCDRFSIDVHKIVNGKMTSIPPPPDQQTSISPQQICDLLLTAAKEQAS